MGLNFFMDLKGLLKVNACFLFLLDQTNNYRNLAQPKLYRAKYLRVDYFELLLIWDEQQKRGFCLTFNQLSGS